MSDDELTALALAADPNAPIDLDVPPWLFSQGFSGTLLPEWYMPTPMARGRGRIAQIAAVSVVVGMIVVCAFGLCVTSGFLQLA
ncbi:MAG: hypothetical protein ACRDVC_08420 [Acidimicrobiales bacterium]